MHCQQIVNDISIIHLSLNVGLTTKYKHLSLKMSILSQNNTILINTYQSNFNQLVKIFYPKINNHFSF